MVAPTSVAATGRSPSEAATVAPAGRSTVAVPATWRSSKLELYLTVLPQIDRSWITVFLLAGVLLWLLFVGNWLAVHVLGVFQPGQGRMLTLIALLLVGVGIFYVYRVLM